MTDDAETAARPTPMSLRWATARVWRLTRLGPRWLKVLTVPAAVALLPVAWVVALVWLLLQLP